MSIEPIHFFQSSCRFFVQFPKWLVFICIYIFLLVVSRNGFDFWVGLRYDASSTTVAPYARQQDAGFIWDDGTLLNGNLLGLTSTEPVRNNYDSFVFAMYSQMMDDINPLHLQPCVCQSFC